MILTGITTYRRNEELYVKVDGWPFGAGTRKKPYVCSCNVCEDPANADWADEVAKRIVSRCRNNNGARKGRVLYLIDYALGGYRPVAAVTYHVTPKNVLQVLAAGVTTQVLSTEVEFDISTLLACGDAIAIKAGLKDRVEWLCEDEEEANDICQDYEFGSGRRIDRGRFIVRRQIEAD
jgi:hypothetical protein